MGTATAISFSKSFFVLWLAYLFLSENITFPDEELSANPKKRSNFISRVWRSLPNRDKDDIITTIVRIALSM